MGRFTQIPFVTWRKIRTFLPIPLAKAISTLAIEVVHAYNHGLGVRKIRRLIKSDYPFLQLELAGGGRELDEFINVGWGTHYPIDLRRTMPFRDATFDRIYSSHVLEHLTPRELENLLVECYRITKPGGIFDVALPNTVESIVRYSECLKGVIPDCESRIDLMQHMCSTDKLVYTIFCDYQHFNIFALDNLTRYLEKAGFCEVRQRKFDDSIDLEVRRDDSFYIVANKTC
jgi:predicted SAM-dependent methyltransferase